MKKPYEVQPCCSPRRRTRSEKTGEARKNRNNLSMRRYKKKLAAYVPIYSAVDKMASPQQQ